jgi:hypothetical protein
MKANICYNGDFPLQHCKFVKETEITHQLSSKVFLRFRVILCFLHFNIIITVLRHENTSHSGSLSVLHCYRTHCSTFTISAIMQAFMPLRTGFILVLLENFLQRISFLTPPNNCSPFMNFKTGGTSLMCTLTRWGNVIHNVMLT